MLFPFNKALSPLPMQVIVIIFEERYLVGVLCSIISFRKGLVLHAATEGKSKYIVKTVFITKI